MPLKRFDIAFQAQTANRVTPDEMDVYEQYQVINPAVSASYFGNAEAGTVSEVNAFTLNNVVADYPRAVALVLSGSASVSGTTHVVGKNQFGASITEDIGQAQGTQEDATVAGTKIFASISAATITMGTGVIGTGTSSLGVPTAAADAIFGLPSKVRVTADVKAITWTNAGLAVALNGGTIAAFVGTANHTFRGTEVLAGTMTYSVLMRSTWKAKGDNLAPIANL